MGKKKKLCHFDIHKSKSKLLLNYSPGTIRSRTLPPAPRIRCHTRAGLTATGRRIKVVEVQWCWTCVLGAVYLFAAVQFYLAGLIEETAASSLLQEAQVLVDTAAGELPGQVVSGEFEDIVVNITQ